MNNKNEITIETIAEQWVRLILVQIRAKKDNDTNTIQTNKKSVKSSTLASNNL